MVKKVFGMLVLLGIIALTGAILWYNFSLGAVSCGERCGVADVIQTIVVPKGEGISALAEDLESKKIIRSALAFKIYARLNNLAGVIQAGSFRISPSMNVSEIASALSKGTNDTWVTLIEGWRNEEIANKLNEDLGIGKTDFLKQAKEGYMFPDTYQFPKTATADYIVSYLENTFDQKYSASLRDKIKRQGLSEAQGVILASIVEREARSDGARTQVASILLKRLKIGMALNADATVQYARDTQLVKQSGTRIKYWQPVTQDDYKDVVSPYNTYLNVGLPPAPICNPSVSSLESVANANPNTAYLYYYHDSKGNSYYATTLEEQNRNAANRP